jgi:hypothetical protein
MTVAEDDKDRGGERSGRYPGVSLKDALEMAEKLYKAERQSPMTNETGAGKMGYKGLSGPARVMIGALRQYGLIEKTVVGQFRLSKLAIEALHGTDAQKSKALKTAAMQPPLFQDLARTHLDGSVDNLSSYLITSKGFIDTGARIAAKAFRETITLAKISASDYSAPIDGVNIEDEDVEAEGSLMDQPGKPGTGEPSGATLPPLSWVLSVPRGVRAELRITGKEVRREDLERLKKQIDFLVESFSDDEA